MPSLCIKPRPRGRTAQLVRHVYSTEKKRSVTLNLGSVRLDADPLDLPYGILLVPGASIAEEDVAVVRAWLQLHGDPLARQQRLERDRRIAAQVELEIAARKVPVDAFQAAADALRVAQDALQFASADCRSRKADPWEELRARYLPVYRAWEAFMKAAQGAGVARTARRRPHTP